MRAVSACTTGRESVPRSLDWISDLSWSSLTFLLPSKAMRLMTGFSTTVRISRPPCTDGWISWNRPEIGADRIGFDPLIALHNDGADGRGLRIGNACRERHDTRTRQHTPEN